MLRNSRQILIFSLYARSELKIRSGRSLSSFRRLVKTDQSRTYRLSSLFPEQIPGSVFLNRVALTLHQTFNPLRKADKDWFKTVKMPPKPPESVRGMQILDKDAFDTTIEVPSLEVPVAQIGPFQKIVKKHMLRMPGVRPVAEPALYDIERDNYRLFLFDPDKFKNVEDFTSIAGSEGDPEKFSVELTSWKILTVNLTYSNWNYDDILEAILPEGSDGVGGFSIIGHIIHLNLKEELLEYKKIIGEVLLDKVTTAETVVNKTNTIDNTFRNFSMEVLAGKDDFITTAKANGLTFKMDFSKVYWNPRLSTEHQRIRSQLKSGDIVYDVFAGIGPFSSPAVRRGCVVFANDLNPESFKWLKINVTPKKKASPPKFYNLDGREFIRSVVKEDLKKRWSEKGWEEEGKYAIHVVMNLPALAVEFLDAFKGLLSDLDVDTTDDVPLPMIHCYTFSKAEDAAAEVKERIEATMGSKLPEDHSIRMVRNVAPNKEMLCAEFQIQKDILMSRESKDDGENGNEPPEKRAKIEEAVAD